MVEDELIGQVIADRYKVLKMMGEGGMGTVYLAEHVTIAKKVALKVLLPEYARKPDLKERFLREARAAAAIDHQNIVDITDFGETGSNSVFFAMEFLDGDDLAHHIKTDGPFPWTRAKRIVLQICRALGAAHAKKIVHRDMKPENIFLVDRDGRPDFVKVLDFGIAKVSGSTDGEHRLTRTGMIFGTPEYMSPEQAQGHSPDHRIDIYAVGVIMYEMLTGQVPFKADTFMGILTKHIFEEPVAPTQAAPELRIPLDVEEIVLKAMSKDRDERFQSMTEMASTISQASGRVTRATGEASPVRLIATSSRVDGRVVIPLASSSPQSVAAGTDVELEPALPTRWARTVAIGALALLLAGGGAVAVKLLSTGGVDESDQTAQQTVSVSVQSEPAGARVLKGTQVLGTTPTVLQLAKSRRGVMLTFTRDGYDDHREPLVPDSDGKELFVKLTKVEAVAEARSDQPGSTGGDIAAGDGRAARSKRTSVEGATGRSGRARRARNAEQRRSRVKSGQTQGSGERGEAGRGSSQQVEDLMNPFN